MEIKAKFAMMNVLTRSSRVMLLETGFYQLLVSSSILNSLMTDKLQSERTLKITY